MNSARTSMNGKPVFTIPAKTVINFDSGFKAKLLCDVGTFTAGEACPYTCLFCYVGSQMRKRKPWLEQYGVKGEHEEIVIRRERPAEIALQQIKGCNPELRRQPMVIYGSPLTDVAANMELVRETVEICKVILENTNWHIRLLSKSNLLPMVAANLSDTLIERKMDGAWQGPRERVIYGVSTGTLDDHLAAVFEKGTPKVSKRIESLRWLQDNGYRTFGMVCPSLPQGDRLSQYDEFAVEMAKAIRVEKCEHIWAEVFNLRGDSFTNTLKALQDAGLDTEAARLQRVIEDKAAWEQYARLTFLAHKKVIPVEKLRFLQYVTKASRPLWEEHKNGGAVIL